MENEKDIKSELNSIDSMIADLLIKKLSILEKSEQIIKYTDSQKDYVICNAATRYDEKYRKYHRLLQNSLFDISEAYQNDINKSADLFLKDLSDVSSLQDKAFALSNAANQDKLLFPETVNATLGSLYDENGVIVALDSVYKAYDEIPKEVKASYASSINGNASFREAVLKWVDKENVITNKTAVVATAGGTGAVSLSVDNFLNPNEIILLPDIAWNSYTQICNHSNIRYETYKLVNDKGEADTTDLMIKCINIMKRQKKLVIILNDPCQNPTGISMSQQQWSDFVTVLNEISKQGKVVLVNDIAYFDYAIDGGRNHLPYINMLNENVVTIICFSCSKTTTAYGMRVGAAIITSKNEQEVDNISNVFTKACRSIWSNINNGFMETFVKLTTEYKQQLQDELAQCRNLLSSRAALFIEGANKNNLPIYPYKEGFFVMVKIDDEQLALKYHQALIDNHIYTIKCKGGIRVAICSINIQQAETLAERMSSILKELTTND